MYISPTWHSSAQYVESEKTSFAFPALLQVVVLNSITKADLCEWVNTYMCPGGHFRQLVVQVSGHAPSTTSAGPPSTEDAVRRFVREHLAITDNVGVLPDASPVMDEGVPTQAVSGAIKSVNFTDAYSCIDKFKSSSTVLPVTLITE